MDAMEPQRWLEAEYLARRRKNESYSLRAFARLLDLPSGRVSQLLSKKRNFTPALGKRIALRLNYDPKRTGEWLQTIEKTKRKNPGALNEPRATYQSLDMDEFQTIADPIHFSILSLLETDKFSGEIKDIAEGLGISRVEARAAVSRLLRVGLVKSAKGGIFHLAKAPGLTTSHDLQSAALREAHKKVLQESRDALEEVAVELRDITSITMAIDPRRLPEAKEKLRALRRGLSEFLETGRRTEVYRLNIQLVPVSKRKRKS